MANMGQMKNPMMAAQMQRDGSNMDMNGQRPQSPGANENAPSPNKRPRMEGMMSPVSRLPYSKADAASRTGGMNAGVPGGQFGEFAGPGQNPQQKNMEVYAQSLAQQHRVALNNTASPQGMNPGVQGSPMGQSGLDGQQDMFAGNGPRPGMPANAPGAPPQQGNHALQDYQMQLMLLEQQNKKRLLMARQEQDNMSGPQHQAGVGAQGFPAAMSPQGNRPGPSPNPADQMKRGTPKLGQGMPPGSPLPEGAMQQQRGSPAPNMNFDPNLAPPGMPPQFYPQMPQQSPMIRPPSSHPGGNFNGQQPNPQQMEAMRNGQMPPNGWRGPQQMGMMPSQHPMGGPMGNNPQQRQQMPPPPAPASDQPRPEPSPSQSNQAPPTPSQSNKAAPKKKATKETTKVKLRASLRPLCIVDINCRRRQIRKVQTQVQRQLRQMVKNHQRQPHRLPWHPSHHTASSHSATSRITSHSNPYSHNNSKPNKRSSNSSSKPWTMVLHHLAQWTLM